MRTQESIKSLCVLLAGLLLLGGCSIENGFWGSQARYERTVEMEHPLTPGSALTAGTANGSVTVTGQPVEKCHVVATIEARAPSEEEAQELAEQVELSFVESGRGLSIRANRPSTYRHRSISISYEIITPNRTSVDCSSASGHVAAVDLEGDVRAHTASGSVRCESVSSGDLHLDSASGGVHLTDASDVGTCRMHAASGSVKAQRLRARSITMDSASGGVTLTDAAAPSISLHTSSGSVRADAIDCACLRAESGSGSVTVTFADTAPPDVSAELRASSGSVRATMPQSFAGQIDLSASSGSVQTDLPVTLRGKVSRKRLRGSIGDGSGTLSAHTGSGSIHIR